VPMIRTALAQTPTVRCVIRHRVGWLALLSSHHTDVPGDTRPAAFAALICARRTCCNQRQPVATKDNLLQPRTTCCNQGRRYCNNGQPAATPHSMLQRPAALAARTCARGGRVTSRVHPEARTRRGARRSRPCRTISSFTCGNCRHGCSRSRHIIACNTVRRGATESSMLQRLHCPASPHLRRRSRGMQPPHACAHGARADRTRVASRAAGSQACMHARPTATVPRDCTAFRAALRMGPTSAPGLGSPLPHVRRDCTAFRAALRMGPGAKAPVATLREYSELLQRYCWATHGSRRPDGSAQWMGWQALQGGGSAGAAGGGGSGSAVGSGSSSKQKLMSMFGRRASQSNVEAQREEVTCSVQRATCNIGCESRRSEAKRDNEHLCLCRGAATATS
jgi:hypothetical protein